METEEKTTKTAEKSSASSKSHHGHAIKRLRRDKKLSQKQLGDLISMCQQNVSHYEEEEKISDELLARFAKGLDVSVDLIKELEDEKPLAYYIENNTFSNKDNSIASGNIGEIGSVTTTNQSDKALYTALEEMQKLYGKGMQLYENSIRLYDRLLQSTEEKIADLASKLSQGKS
ncbi:helix-turn-helix domain-containing protein [Parabacteroides pacaensis]|uniref:helix-turn-helix domain-containing protein n=1 Tax=Parabacteroides pacaensis TaxID=2086575 RepID=UPI000D0FB6DC|nr:helix-turn-helix transcriptional regulator [Parabacteroides pacaensis]